jgi:hypothetical protein
MKKVVLYWKKTSEDETWARQFAGEDTQLVQEFQPSSFPPGTNLPDFPIRKRIGIAGQTPTWGALIQSIQDAASAAGRDGVVLLLGGHGGSFCVTADDRIVPRCQFSDVGVVTFDPDKQLGFNQEIVNYTKPRSASMNSSLHDEDMQAILGKKLGRIMEMAKGHPTNAKQRWEIWSNFDRIGRILRSNQILRVVFLSCSVGASARFLDDIADAWGVQVAAFKFHVTIIPPDNFPDHKARFVFKRDKDRTGQGTNVPLARVFTPSLNDPNLAYVAEPNVWAKIKMQSATTNVWERVKQISNALSVGSP